MLKFDANGLIPAVVQDATTRQVLMVGYMDREALRRTVDSGQAWFWSRSRRELWHKGATSGHYLNVRTLRLDCDGDTILVEADPAGPTCHTGAVSCFFNDLDPTDLAATDDSTTATAGTSPQALAQDIAAVSPPEPDELPLAPAPVPAPASSPPPRSGEESGGSGLDGRTVEALFAVIQQRQQQRPEGSYVVKLLDGGIDRIAKKVGEEATEVVIAAKNGAADEITWEVADLWFHSLVLLAATGLTPAEIWQELDRRRK